MQKYKPYLIAEIGGNHEGNKVYAKKLINQAIKSKVDCIKLQIYSGESLVNKFIDESRYNHFKKFSLKIDDYIELAKYSSSFTKSSYLSLMMLFSNSGWFDQKLEICSKFAASSAILKNFVE